MVRVGSSKGIMKTKKKAVLDNRSNQLNPQHQAYHRARGRTEGAALKAAQHEPSRIKNRAIQLNPNNGLFGGDSEK